MPLIEWMSEWLKQIILLVLIATFIDLLIPDSSLERYVKLVVGLLIIMSILSPIFKLLDRDLDLSSIVSGLTNSNQADISMQEVKQNSDQLKQKQTQLVGEQTEEFLSRQMSQDVHQRFPVEVVESKVIAPSAKGIEGVQMVARLKDTDTSQSSHIEPIKPVWVDGSSGSSNKSMTTTDPRCAEVKQKIQNYLKETWKLLGNQVHVTVEPAW